MPKIKVLHIDSPVGKNICPENQSDFFPERMPMSVLDKIFDPRGHRVARLVFLRIWTNRVNTGVA